MSFFTQIIQADRRYISPDRCADLALLEPNTRRKVIAMLADAAGHGQSFVVYETYRSQARQQALFAIGATQLHQVGVHHFGLACDFARVVNGQPSWSGDFSILAKLALAHGLISGQNWGTPQRSHGFIDAGHVQRCSVRDQAALFSGKWYPDDEYNPYEHL